MPPRPFDPPYAPYDPGRALMLDTQNRTAILVGFLLGIVAAIGGGAGFAMIAGSSAMRGGLLAATVIPMMVCYGLGHAVYRVLNAIRK